MKSTKSSRLRSSELQRLKQQVRERTHHCEAQIRALCGQLDPPLSTASSSRGSSRRSSPSSSTARSDDRSDTEPEPIPDDPLTMKQALDVDDWFYRIADVYTYSKQQLLERFYRGKCKKQVQFLPLDHVCHVLNDLEPSARDPLTPAMQRFLRGFASKHKGEYVVDMAAALDSLVLWPTAKHRVHKAQQLPVTPPPSAPPRKPSLPLTVEEPLLADIARALGADGVQHARELLVRQAKEPYQHVDHVLSTLQSLVRFRILPDAFYDLCVGFPMSDATHVDIRALVDAMRDHLRFQVRPTVTTSHELGSKPHTTPLEQLREAFRTHRISHRSLLQQCSLFDFEDDGCIALAACLSILQSFPCHTLSMTELTALLQPYTENQCVQYNAMADALCAPPAKVFTPRSASAKMSLKTPNPWAALQAKLYHDTTTEARVYDKLHAIFQKLSVDHTHISEHDLHRVLGNHWSAAEIAWVIQTLYQRGAEDEIDMHAFYEHVFPHSSKKSKHHKAGQSDKVEAALFQPAETGSQPESPPTLKHVHVARAEVKSAFEEFAAPYSGYLTPRQAVSAIELLTSPMEWTEDELDDMIVALDTAGNGQIRLQRLWDLLSHKGQTTTFGTAKRFESDDDDAVHPGAVRPLPVPSPKARRASPRKSPPPRRSMSPSKRTKAPLRSDMADIVRRLRHAITTHSIPLHVLFDDADDGSGRLSSRQLCDVLWPIADQYTTVKHDKLLAMLELLEASDGTVGLTDVADVIFDWPGLKQHLQSIASFSEVLTLFQARDPDHHGRLRLAPDFEHAFFKIFRTQLQAWELRVMHDRFGVTLSGEPFVDYGALVTYLLPRSPVDLFEDLVDNVVPGKSQGDQEIYRSFKRFDMDEKGYFDRKDVKRMLQETLDVEPSPDELDAVYRQFLSPSSPDQVVRLQRFRAIAHQRL
ncbi:hypothetical protein SDRG_16853 [Saprolegnia diclina VS20]|uniref:EF-hand domain-containing protein n=1 Tax=Saprolegnia diclina (strain VS20) TaxID=1156394 RepID=T0QZW0_SAPDV|nr:hypothetical protein SDRG_16853 [Saprolegnia diclina VS20]EQC25273.1 hypothetical protein SDRG_16853 [Saprolegnia diclina VS20]|eukprot:XP_008621298.1 hypothetical protein SDRG_16853 [Saprolegnia diclina VS20]